MFKAGIRVAFCIFSVFFSLTLCADAGRKILKQPKAATLLVSRSGTRASLQWRTVPGLLYTVMYAKDRSTQSQWKPHMKCTRIPGTGETFTMTDVIPLGVDRVYRLQIEPYSTH